MTATGADLTDVLVCVCAWCGADMGKKPAPGAMGAVSHGMCHVCLEEWRTRCDAIQARPGPCFEVTLRRLVPSPLSIVTDDCLALFDHLPAEWELHTARFVP